MERKLSREFISSYQEDVLPLRLLGGTPYSTEEIRWTCENEDLVQITSFAGDEYGDFTDGILLTLLAVGETEVHADFEGKRYSCKVEVRERRHFESGRDMFYFIGDMHDHTCSIHKLDAFSVRTERFPIDYVNYIRDEGLMDFGVISDHASCLTKTEFFRGYAEVEEAGPLNQVYFCGAEGQLTIRMTDRYGAEHMNGGEVLMFNADTCASARSWEEMFQKFSRSPYAFFGFPHPQIVGHSVPGVWDFNFDLIDTDQHKKLFRFVEMGDGSNRSANIVQEYVYSVALDHGFRVSPTCASDSHGKKYGFYRFPGKTIIMAPERSKEAFYDAILNNRMYASTTGNVKVYYSVNGKAAPCTLQDEGEYRFHVETGFFRFDESTAPKRMQVISDGGRTLLEMDSLPSSVDFTLYAPDAHYFYLIFIDEEGRKTWSCPVWTGKAFEKKIEAPLSPLPKLGVKAKDEISGKDASELICDDPTRLWFSEETTASLLIDLKKQQDVCAFSHYPRFFSNAETRAAGIENHQIFKQFPCRYRLSLSRDGKDFSVVSSGMFRRFGQDEFFRFPKTRARYARLEILSTVGKNYCRKEFEDATICLAEITFWNESKK